MTTRRTFLGRGAAIVLPALLGCDVREFARAHGAKLRLSIATGPAGGVYYVYGGGVAKLISLYVPNVEATAEVTGASVDNLKFLRDGKADLALTLSDTLKDAFDGTSAFRRYGRVPATALAQLYTNYMHVVTTTDAGIASISDLRGRTIATGAPGSGTEATALRALAVAGLDPARDVNRQALSVNPASEALKDGKLDAFFWSSGVPNGAVIDLTTMPNRRIAFIPTAELVPAMNARYGGALYFAAAIPRGAYSGLASDVPVIGVANFLVADRAMGEQLVYDVTRVLFEHQPELVAIHPEARHLALESAVERAPVPFHDGAKRYYQERGVWRT